MTTSIRRIVLILGLFALSQGLAACDRCGDFSLRLPGTGSCRAPAPVQ
jgi:hypothetical protein